MIATAIGGLLLILGAMALTASYGISIDQSPIIISEGSTESHPIAMADSIEVTQPDDWALHVSLSSEAGIEIVIADTDTPRVEYPTEFADYITVSENDGLLRLLIGRTDSLSEQEKAIGRTYYRYVECPYPIRVVLPSSPAKVRSTLSNVPVMLKDASADSVCLQIRGTARLDGCRLAYAMINPAGLGPNPEVHIGNTAIAALAVGERMRRLTLKADSLSTVGSLSWHSALNADDECTLNADRARIRRISFTSVTDSTGFTLQTSGAVNLNSQNQ